MAELTRSESPESSQSQESPVDLREAHGILGSDGLKGVLKKWLGVMVAKEASGLDGIQQRRSMERAKINAHHRAMFGDDYEEPSGEDMGVIVGDRYDQRTQPEKLLAKGLLAAAIAMGGGGAGWGLLQVADAWRNTPPLQVLEDTVTTIGLSGGQAVTE